MDRKNMSDMPQDPFESDAYAPHRFYGTVQGILDDLRRLATESMGIQTKEEADRIARTLFTLSCLLGEIRYTMNDEDNAGTR